MANSHDLSKLLNDFLASELLETLTNEEIDTLARQDLPALELGETALSNEVYFTAELMDCIAYKTESWSTFEQFCEKLEKKIPSPKKNDPLLALEAQKLLSKAAPGKQKNERALEQIKDILYDKKLAKYAEKKKEVEAFGGDLRPDKKSYFRFIFRSLPAACQTFFLSIRKFRIVEFYRQKHTLITGGTGSGKSEIAKTLAHHYLTKDTSPALVVIDPHGDLATDIAQFHENTDGQRLIFIDLTIRSGFTPVLNPFDVGPLSEADFDIVSGQVVNLLGIMLSEENQFTEQMKAILKPCVETLLKLPNTNLEHLKQFFDDEHNPPLKRKAMEILSNPSDRDFMTRDFNSSSYATTKQSIRTRLHLLLTQERFRNFVVGKSTLDLKSAIDARKVIFFKFTSQDSTDAVTIALGRLIVGSLLAMTMRRGILPKPARKQQVPIHLFIDEAHNFSHPTLATILSESRKYKLYLTLITQFAGKFPHPKIREELEMNIGLTITGRQTAGTKGAIANEKLMGIENNSLSKLRTGEFYLKALSLPAFRIKNGGTLVSDRNAMSPEEWEQIIETQLQRHYRPNQPPEEAEKSFLYRDEAFHSPTPPKGPQKRFRGTLKAPLPLNGPADSNNTPNEPS